MAEVADSPNFSPVKSASPVNANTQPEHQTPASTEASMFTIANLLDSSRFVLNI
jgi:hypothetical protein